MNELQKKRRSIDSVFTALFAALIAVTGFIAVPIPGSPMPIVLQNMIPILAGSLLGGIQGAGATGLFLAAGALGLPVFSGGRGGIPHLAGPTGGFLIGYFFASLVTGFFIGKASVETKTLTFRIIVGVVLGFVLMYIPGVIQFMAVTKSTFEKAMALCVLPYLIGDTVKIVVTCILAIKLRPVLARYLATK